MATRHEIYKESLARMKTLAFGDPVTNICAGENNPMRHCYFVEFKKPTGVRCTDKKGNFWCIEMNVIHPGHLDEARCKELFQPVWDSEYGKQA